MQRDVRQGFAEVFQHATDAAKEKKAFLGAAARLKAGLDKTEEKNALQAGLDLASSGQGQSTAEFCLSVYLLIRDYSADKADAHHSLAEARKEV